MDTVQARARLTRILITGKSFELSVGGVEQILHNMLHGLCGKFEIFVLTVNEKTVSEKMPFHGATVLKSARLLKILSAPLSFRFLMDYKEVSSWADIIIHHGPNPIAELAHLLVRPKKPVLYVYHFDVTRQRWLNMLYQPMLETVLRRSDAIAVSSPAMPVTSGLLRRVKSKCTVVPHGVDHPLIRSIGADSKGIEKIRSQYPGPIVLFSGRLVHYKGLVYLIKAMQGIDATLLILGDGELKGNLQNLSVGLGLVDRIFFLPRQSRKDQYLFFHACDIFVLPSATRTEAFGIVLAEAMAAGKPVVSTELGTGTSYVNLNGETGFVVPPCDPGALNKAISTLVGDAELRKVFGTAAALRSETFFSADKNAEAYRELVKTVGKLAK